MAPENKMMDVHTHTIYSDGCHTAEEILLNSIRNKINVIGISDHHKAFFMDKPKYRPFEEYIKQLNYLKKKYKDKIEVKCGIELNVNFEDEAVEERIPYKKLKKLDFVLLERVEGLAAFELSNNCCVKFKDIGRITNKLKCRLGLAHTDLLELSRIYSKGRSIECGMDYVVSVMKKYNLFYELNTRTEHEYFDYILNNWDNQKIIKLFQKIREENIEITSGTDTHLISEDFDINRLRLANKIASGELMPGRDKVQI